jgi:hypothetical protein
MVISSSANDQPAVFNLLRRLSVPAVLFPFIDQFSSLLELIDHPIRQTSGERAGYPAG